MNKYQALFRSNCNGVSPSELLRAADNVSDWEDGYWIAKIWMTGNYDIPDDKVIDLLEYCFFAGLPAGNREIFFDANECLAKLYLRYSMYREAASKLMLLAYNYDCPDWVHLYLAMAQLYTTFDRIVEEPRFFFDRLLQADFNNTETRCEVRNIFGKYLCMIVENPGESTIASREIIAFAEKIRFTTSDEFKVFHQIVCPNLPYTITADQLQENAPVHHEEATIKARAAALEEELSKARKVEEEYSKQLQAQRAEMERMQREKVAREEQQRSFEAAIKKKLTAKDSDIAKLEGEKTFLAKRLLELEQAKKTEMLPQNIDDVYQKITTWLNCSLRRYLAQWLTSHFEKTCSNDYWNKKVKPALLPPELKRFDSYKELTDFAFDAVLNIYYNNLNDFHTYNSMAKTNDRERIEEMHQVRNRWVGHFEENSWTKERILFDLDTIIEFIQQIDMPKERQKEYMEFRAAVVNMS